MSHLIKTGIAAAAFSVASIAAYAADTTLTISSWAPKLHSVCRDFAICPHGEWLIA